MRVFFFVLALGLFAAGFPVHAQTTFSEDCLTNGANNATLVIEQSVSPALADGQTIDAGDTVFAYDSEGQCVGYAVWSGTDDISFPVAGPNPATNDTALQGYAPEEPLKLKVHDASADVTTDFGADLVYKACSEVGLPMCQADGTYASDALLIVQGFASTTLPVEMASLTLTREQQRVRIAWETVSETQNAGWEVQHRPASASGGWAPLGFVEGTGTTDAPQAYTYRTEALDVGTHRFRLKQVDHDGTTEMSDVVETTISMQRAYQLSEVAPNPLRQTGRLDLAVREAQTVSVRLYDVMGRQIATLFHGSVSANRPTEIQVDAGRQSAGTYFVRVTGETFSATRRVSIVR